MVRVALLCLAVLLPSAALAEDLSTLSDAELMARLQGVELKLARPQRLAIYGIPSGYGLSRGQAVAGVSATNRRNRGGPIDWDGSLGFAYGLGDPDRIGITPVVAITSVTPYHFGSSGFLGVVVNHRFDSPWGPASVAIGSDNLVRWGDAGLLEVGGYAAVSGVVGTERFPILATLGWGSEVADQGRKSGLFGGLSASFGNVAASAAWAGDEAILALNLWPLGDSLQLSLGVGDPGNNLDSRRFLISLSWSGRIRGR